MRVCLLAILVTAGIIVLGYGKDKQRETQLGQHPGSFRGEITKAVALDYLLFLPQDYGRDPEKKWPLMLFLHGAGERGNSLELLKKHGPPKIVEQQPDFPFIVVSPQCPSGLWWPEKLDDLSALLDEVEATYTVDSRRIHLTWSEHGRLWHLEPGPGPTRTLRCYRSHLRRREALSGPPPQGPAGMGFSRREGYLSATGGVREDGGSYQAGWRQPPPDSLPRRRPRFLDQDV